MKIKAKETLKTIIVVLSITLIGILSACSKQTQAITKEEFISIMEEENFEVVDQTELIDATLIETSVIATSEKGYEGQYYVFNSIENAKSYILNNKENLKSLYGSQKSYEYKETNGNNSESFTITFANSLFYVARVDNTIFYVKSSNANEKEIQQLIKRFDN